MSDAGSPLRATRLITDANLESPDEFYEALMHVHHELTGEQSAAVNAALILLLANHIGDSGVLREAMRRAREAVVDDPPARPR